MPSTVSHARLRLRHQVQEGLHRLSLLLQDSGQPPQHREQLLNVTVCHCGQDGVCLQGAAALRAKGTGLSLGALGIVLASVILLFCECPCPETTALSPTSPPHTHPTPPSPGGQPHPCLPAQCSPCRWPSSHGSDSSHGTRGFYRGCRMTSGTTSSTMMSRGAGRKTR